MDYKRENSELQIWKSAYQNRLDLFCITVEERSSPMDESYQKEYFSASGIKKSLQSQISE